MKIISAIADMMMIIREIILWNVSSKNSHDWILGKNGCNVCFYIFLLVLWVGLTAFELIACTVPYIPRGGTHATFNLIPLKQSTDVCIYGLSCASSTVDIWSVGCIMAEMLQGKPLFKGNDRILSFLGIIFPCLSATIVPYYLIPSPQICQTLISWRRSWRSRERHLRNL